jgi:hypothetical protein
VGLERDKLGQMSHGTHCFDASEGKERNYLFTHSPGWITASHTACPSVAFVSDEKAPSCLALARNPAVEAAANRL